MKTPPFRTVTIIGVGLIGGSFGLAIKRRFPDIRVIGVDRPPVLRKAMRRKVIDEATTTLPTAVRNADLVILATPIETIIRLLPVVAANARAETLVTDTGSVKASVVREAGRWFSARNFIGGHPMAGVELAGVEAAHPLLFENAIYVLTPGVKALRSSLHRLSAFLSRLGARPFVMDPAVHDQVAAAVSHVPQLTAVGLMNLAGKKHPVARYYLRLAAGGFRDLTRIASSPFKLWSQILPINRREIVRSLELLIGELRRYQSAVQSRDKGKLRGSFRSARTLRNAIPRNMKGFIHRLAEIQVFVWDQPGMLARLTTALARAKININDIELMKVREGKGGTFRLAFESQDLAARAARVLRKAGFEAGEMR